MSKLEVVGTAVRGQRPRGRAELSEAIGGYIAELRRDLAVHMKQMRQLQEQADELHVMIREWASQAEPILTARRPASRRVGPPRSDPDTRLVVR